MQEAVQIAGALLVLAAFVLGQCNLLAADSRAYLSINAVGSAVLTATAIVSAEWGFVLLEACWALVSLYGLVQTLRGAASGPLH